MWSLKIKDVWLMNHQYFRHFSYLLSIWARGNHLVYRRFLVDFIQRPMVRKADLHALAPSGPYAHMSPWGIYDALLRPAAHRPLRGLPAPDMGRQGDNQPSTGKPKGRSLAQASLKITGQPKKISSIQFTFGASFYRWRKNSSTFPTSKQVFIGK